MQLQTLDVINTFIKQELRLSKNQFNEVGGELPSQCI